MRSTTPIVKAEAKAQYLPILTIAIGGHLSPFIDASGSAEKPEAACTGVLEDENGSPVLCDIQVRAGSPLVTFLPLSGVQEILAIPRVVVVELLPALSVSDCEDRVFAPRGGHTSGDR
jgi:hypothetical protein